MAGTVNKVILIGRLGSDPDVRYSADGSAVVRFNIATDEPIKTPEGTWDKRPEWHRIVAFGKTAEICGTYMNKGKLVYIEGKLQRRQWEDNQGVKRSTTEIVAREVHLLGGAGGGGDRPPQTQSNQAGMKTYAGPPATEELPPPSGGPDEEIPF
jgi:single-strand DNA-binding protein